MDHPRHIIDRLTFVMERQPGVASRTETDLAGMHFQLRCGVAHQNPHKIITPLSDLMAEDIFPGSRMCRVRGA